MGSTLLVIMAPIEVSPDAATTSGPIFDTKPIQKVPNCDKNYNVFSNDVFDNDSEHPEQPNYINDTYPVEQGDNHITPDSLDMSHNGEKDDQDDQMIQTERDLLASLIEQLKLEIDGRKQHNKSLDSSNKSLREANTFLQSEITSFVKPEYLKKAQIVVPRLYDIRCYNDNLALMLTLDSDEMIRLAQESRSKLSDFIRPFDYEKLNNMYDLFVPQREKTTEQKYFSNIPKEYFSSVIDARTNEKLHPTAKLLSKAVSDFHNALTQEMVKDLQYFKSCETNFPAIVYDDTSTSSQNVPSEPTDDAEAKIKMGQIDMTPFPPRKQRHPFLRYQGLEYSDQDIADFEERLERIYDRDTHIVQVVDFEGMPELMRDVLHARMLMEHHDDDGIMVFTRQAL
ncbi:hypothetical protein Tco_0582885 [Tanacetum coccineum]